MKDTKKDLIKLEQKYSKKAKQLFTKKLVEVLSKVSTYDVDPEIIKEAIQSVYDVEYTQELIDEDINEMVYAAYARTSRSIPDENVVDRAESIAAVAAILVTRASRDSIGRAIDFLVGNGQPLNADTIAEQAARFADNFIDGAAGYAANNARNAGRLYGYQAVEPKYAVISGVDDDAQCPDCAALDGRRIEINLAIEYLENHMDDMAQEVVHVEGDTITLGGRYIPYDAAAEALADAGVMPPFHPNCRCSYDIEE